MDRELTTNDKGVIAEAEVMAAAIRLGYVVWRPINERGRYDLGIDAGHGILRVQVKWAPRKGDVVVVHTRTSRYTPHGYVNTIYTADEIDAVAAYCPELHSCFLIPAQDLDGRGTLHLRLAPAKNGQRGGVTMASDYEFGAVAQLEERRAGSAKARGSSPLSSTSHADTVIGSHEFRNRFGWYLDRSAAGERFLITRHGKPYACLSSPGGAVASEAA